MYHWISCVLSIFAPNKIIFTAVASAEEAAYALKYHLTCKKKHYRTIETNEQKKKNIHREEKKRSVWWISQRQFHIKWADKQNGAIVCAHTLHMHTHIRIYKVLSSLNRDMISSFLTLHKHFSHQMLAQMCCIYTVCVCEWVSKCVSPYATALRVSCRLTFFSVAFLFDSMRFGLVGLVYYIHPFVHLFVESYRKNTMCLWPVKQQHEHRY